MYLSFIVLLCIVRSGKILDLEIGNRINQQRLLQTICDEYSIM